MKLKEIPAGGGFHAWHYENGALDVAARQFVVQIYLNDERIRELNLDKNIIIDELVEILQSFDFITNAYSAEFILNAQNLSGYEKLIQK